MPRPQTRALLVLAGTALLSALLTMPVAAATHDPTGVCIGDAVTVVVDFTELGGKVEVGCTEGQPESISAALKLAGFDADFVSPGRNCSIDSRPASCTEELGGPDWSFFTAKVGEDWSSAEMSEETSVSIDTPILGWRYGSGLEGPDFPPVSGEQSDSEAATPGPTVALDKDATVGPHTSGTSSTTSLEVWRVSLIVFLIIGGVLSVVSIVAWFFSSNRPSI